MEEKEMMQTVLTNLTNEENEKLINLMKSYNIDEGIIVITIIGIGTHTEFYNVLNNRIKNYKGPIINDTVKMLVADLMKDIDRSEGLE